MSTQSLVRSGIAEREPTSTDLPPSIHPFLGEGDTILAIDRASLGFNAADAESQAFIFAPDILQDQPDYRGLLQSWFGMLRIGGRLAIRVPHAFLCERELALPSRTHAQRRRLYSPATLASEVEEALVPNSYRIRLLCDDDAGYDYALEQERVGAQSILMVLERIASPAWPVESGEVEAAAPPDFAFEPARTRREIVALAPRRRIVILKLDHLGDFIMGIPALEKARAMFSDADITLVVGSWNAAMARDLDVADTVLAFDAFPRNSSEETVDLPGRRGDFERLLTADYDLAIDLRTDSDTRFFLRSVRAGLRAGIGTRSQFDFLDIFLPIDGTRHGFEAVSDQRIGHQGFSGTLGCRSSAHRIAFDPGRRKGDSQHGDCLMFGPYIRLEAGDYIYEPFIDIEGDGGDLLSFDVACGMVSVTQALGSSISIPRLRFTVDTPSKPVEFRIMALPDRPAPAFSFYGGRLLRRGASSVLHQSEYLSLLIDLIAMRTDQFGVLQSVSGVS